MIKTLGDGALSLREAMTSEELPLATIHDAVLGLLRGREDIALFGAQAVNAYVGPPRMTQAVDVFSMRAQGLAEEIRSFLAARFTIAVRVREVAAGRGFRVYQLRKTGNRHLVAVRQVDVLPPTRDVAGFRVVSPEELLAEKTVAYHHRKGQPKSGTDWRDLALLLLAFPHLKASTGLVRQRLEATDPHPDVLATWEDLVSQDIRAEEDEGW